MKITIDTKEDSHAEIKKVISLLTHLIGQTPPSNKNIFDNPEPSTETNNLFSIFDNNKTETKTTKIVPEEESQEDKPQIIPY